MAPFSDEMNHSSIEGTDMNIAELKITSGGRRGRGVRARNWNLYLTEESAARRPSALKAAFRHLSIPGIISLGGGLPLPAYFPIHEVTVKVPSVGNWSEEETALDGAEINIVKYSNAKTIPGQAGGYGNRVMNGVEKLSISSSGWPTVGLSTTLQYGLGTGEPHLVSFLKQHTEMVHNPPYEDWSTTLTCGNTYSFYMCLRMLVERGDYVIMEEYAYSSAISTCRPMGIKIVGIEMDEQGMTATGLHNVLRTWDIASRGARKPRVVYLVPLKSSLEGKLMVELGRIQLEHRCSFNVVKISIEFVRNTI
jgi:aromatic amino acid aminotransferase I / 2-aminoadipate transaminase